MQNSRSSLEKFLIIYHLAGAILAFLVAIATLIVDFIVFGNPPGTGIFIFLLVVSAFFALLGIMFSLISIIYKQAKQRTRDEGR